MPYFKYTPYNKKYPISRGGSWMAHLRRSDVGVDRPIPCGTEIYNVFKRAMIKRRYVWVPPWSKHKPAGVRRIVQMIELNKDNKQTGRIFEIWHITKLADNVNGKIVEGRQLVAYSGNTGAYGCHVHEVAYHAITHRPFNHTINMNLIYKLETDAKAKASR